MVADYTSHKHPKGSGTEDRVKMWHSVSRCASGLRNNRHLRALYWISAEPAVLLKHVEMWLKQCQAPMLVAKNVSTDASMSSSNSNWTYNQTTGSIPTDAILCGVIRISHQCSILHHWVFSMNVGEKRTSMGREVFFSDTLGTR